LSLHYSFEMKVSFDLPYILLCLQRGYQLGSPLSLWQPLSWGSTKDIFALGWRDHRFYDHNTLPLCFPANYVHNHLATSTSHALIKWQATLQCFDSSSKSCDSSWNDICPFSSEHLFPKFLTWLTIFFNPLAAVQWKDIVPEQETRSYVSGFPLGYCDRSYIMNCVPNYDHSSTTEKRP
jgi:hypothetical protein